MKVETGKSNICGYNDDDDSAAADYGDGDGAAADDSDGDGDEDEEEDYFELKTDTSLLWQLLILSATIMS